MNLKLSITNLKIVSLGYLFLPILLFFGAWLKIWIAVPLLLITIYCFWQFISFQQPFKDDHYNLKLWQLVTLFIIAILWVSVSGSGGMGLQSHDHAKTNAIFKDIIERPIPTSYLIDNQVNYLSTYLAYYLPAPFLFGKISWTATMVAAYFWTLAGVILSLLWFLILCGRYSVLAVVFFVFASGMDIAGLFSSLGFAGTIKELSTHFYEKQPFFAIMTDPKMMLLYQSNTHCLFWAPQHAISSWLVSGMFFYEMIFQKNVSRSAFYLAILPFWSPFILVGLAPYFLYMVYKQGFRSFFNHQNIIMIPILIVTFWFVNSIPMGEVNKGFIFYKANRLLGYFDQFKAYVFFLVFEVGIWLLLIYFIFKNKQVRYWKNILYFVAICLIIIPLYTLGKFNDWSQRVSMPSILLLWVLVVRAYFWAKPILKLALGSVFILSAWDPVFFILLSLKVTGYQIKSTAMQFEKVPNYVQTSIEQKWPIYHSFAPENASFFKYLAKKPNRKILEKLDGGK